MKSYKHIDGRCLISVSFPLLLLSVPLLWKPPEWRKQTPRQEILLQERGPKRPVSLGGSRCSSLCQKPEKERLWVCGGETQCCFRGLCRETYVKVSTKEEKWRLKKQALALLSKPSVLAQDCRQSGGSLCQNGMPRKRLFGNFSV